jgi:hypothetical protein
MKEILTSWLLPLAPNGLAFIFCAITLLVSWFTGWIFRNKEGRLSIPLVFASLISSILFGLYIFIYGIGSSCEYLGYKFPPNQGFVYIVFFPVIVILLSWVVMMISISRYREL